MAGCFYPRERITSHDQEVSLVNWIKANLEQDGYEDKVSRPLIKAITF